MLKANTQNLIRLTILIIMISGCQTFKSTLGKAGVKKRLKSSIFSSQFTGFVLYDPATEEYLFRQNEDLYFTPASNIKILTTLACLETFSDSIPSFSYAKFSETYYIEPLGDPTFLHPDFPVQPVVNKLYGQQVKVHFPEEQLPLFGPGWAWDDYHLNFQQQTAWFPMYSNEVRITSINDSIRVSPGFFQGFVNILPGPKPWNALNRELKYNLFNVWKDGFSDTSDHVKKIPFDYSQELALELLKDTLKGSTSLINQLDFKLDGTLYNQATIPALGLMMLRSDNFLAEQLLITAARSSGFYNIQAFRNYLLERWKVAPAGIQWVDGSGLSRYNLVTPVFLVMALKRIYELEDWNTVRWMFPTGGSSGTIKNWYGATTPYIFAKTGTLKNNHSLSGYVKTDSGKILIFSLMNNHYVRPVSEVKKEMEDLFEWIRKRY